MTLTTVCFVLFHQSYKLAVELKPDQSQAWMNMGGIQHIKVANVNSFLKSKHINTVPYCGSMKQLFWVVWLSVN